MTQKQLLAIDDATLALAADNVILVISVPSIVFYNTWAPAISRREKRNKYHKHSIRMMLAIGQPPEPVAPAEAPASAPAERVLWTATGEPTTYDRAVGYIKKLLRLT